MHLLAKPMHKGSDVETGIEDIVKGRFSSRNCRLRH